MAVNSVSRAECVSRFLGRYGNPPINKLWREGACLNKLKTYPQTCILDTLGRCDRVPPAGATEWGPIDLKSLQEDDLPLDPRSWDRQHVATWVSRRGGLSARFPMNGKALCLMTKEMFQQRVPTHGHRLHQEFRRRLAKALTIQELIEKLTKANAK